MSRHRFFKERRGSSLILVLIVFTVFLVLGGAVLTYGTVSTYRTRAQTDGQQAYFIARSAVSATVRYIRQDGGMQQKIAALTPDDDTLTGSYAFPEQSVAGSAEAVRIQATQFAGGRPSALRVTASADCNGASASAAAYLKGSAAAVTPSNPSAVYPFDNLIYIDSSSGVGQCHLTGNVAARGAFSYGSGSTIDGVLAADGDVTLDGAGSGLTAVKTPGSVTITGSGTVTAGNVYAGGDVDMSGSGTVNGSVYAGGSAIVSGSGCITGSLYAHKGMSLSGGSRIGGDVYANGLDVSGSPDKNLNVSSGRIGGSLYLHNDLNMSGGTVLGNVLVQGNGTFSGGSVGADGSGQTGNVACSGSVAITNWGVTFRRSLTYGGLLTIPKDSSWSNFVPNQPVMSAAPLNVPAVPAMPAGAVPDFSAALPTSVALPSVPGSESDPIRVSSLIAAGAPLTHSGYIRFDYGSQQAVLTVDTGGTLSSANDIYLIVSGSQTIAQTLNVQVTGVNRLFLYLKGDQTTLTICHNFLMKGNDGGDGAVTPRIYIIGTGRGQQVSLVSNSKVDAYIYLPLGKFSAGGGTDGRYNLFGSVCAGAIDVNANVYLRYAPPDLSGTPLEGLASGGSGSDSGGSDSAATWTLDGWADQ